MEQIYIEDKTFDGTDFMKETLVQAQYDNCTFINCNFSDSNLSDLIFLECTFTGCNLGMAKLVKTSLKTVKFKDCKLLGLRFDTCNEFLFAVSFDNCLLNLSCFYKRKLRKTIFKNTSLHEVDFTEADLSGAVFTNCDMAGAIFENTILEKADLRTSINYSINPELNKISKSKFSKDGIAGLLDKYDIEIH